MNRAFLYGMTIAAAVGALAPVGTARARLIEPVSLNWRVGGVIADSAIWESYKSRFVAADGRMIDTGRGGAHQSEAQGHGLLLAVAAGDRAAFDRVLSWTREHLMTRDDYLVAGQEHDSRDVADGDILIAWALAEAADLWREPSYAVIATRIAQDVRDHLIVARAGYGTILNSDFVADEGAERPVRTAVNPSSWVLPAFNRLAQLAPSPKWSALVKTETALLNSPILTDTSRIAEGGAGATAELDLGGASNPVSIRAPLYLFWSGTSAPEFSARFARSSAGWSDAAGRAEPTEPGYQSVAALARCDALGAPYPASFYGYAPTQDFYPATLQMLSATAAIMRGGPCLDEAAMAGMLGRRRLEPALDVASVAPALAAGAARPVEAANPTIEASAGSDRLDAILRYARMLALAMGLAALATWAPKWRKRKIARSIEAVFDRGRHSRPVEGAAKPVPRVLPTNPFEEPSSEADFDAQIERAAALSVDFGRTLGVLIVDLKDSRVDLDHAEADIGRLMGSIQKLLRSTDCVRLINDHEILIVASLLDSLEQLEKIGGRICALARSHSIFGAAFEAGAGSAIYPVCGYSGRALAEHARRRYRALKGVHEAKTHAIESGVELAA